ncbi:hypothetical protein B0H14DRAFT_3901808 [Mycena olivaceomarginata]|nr:hypothetical protein B0H14DRAFT_3901808 [Mycena olivaceomarginata]
MRRGLRVRPGWKAAPRETCSRRNITERSWCPPYTSTTSNTMGTSPAPPPPPADPFKDHLLAVLSLHDAPRAAAAPIPRYSGPRDWQTDAILRKIEALMKRAPSPAAKTNGASHSPTPTPPAASNKAQSTPTPTLASLPAVNGYSRSASPDSEAGPLTCPQCGHRPLHFPGIDYAESPGVVPTGGALANAATQGGMDALEELRLLKDQVRDVSRVCNAVATGDLTQKITVPVQGDLMVQLKKVINTMVDNLGHFATEVTRVSRDVGTEGKLGAQAHVEDVEGTWRELTDEVNTLAANLTTQVRSIAAVTTAVAKGDLSKQIDVSAKGEILDLKNTVNGMMLRLRTLAVEVTRVTLELLSAPVVLTPFTPFMAERPTSIPWSPSSHRHAQLISHGHTPSSFSHDRRLLSPEAAYARGGSRSAEFRGDAQWEVSDVRLDAILLAALLSPARLLLVVVLYLPFHFSIFVLASRWFQDGNVRVVGEPSSSRWGDIDVVRVSQGGKHYSCTASTPSRSRADEEVGGHEIGVAVCGGE